MELNIGLDSPNGKNTLQDRVRRQATALRILAANLDYSQVRDSNTEPTLVVKTYVSVSEAVLYDIAVVCEQDCVAAYNPDTGAGQLVGPKAAEWGDFNPDYFIRP